MIDARRPAVRLQGVAFVVMVSKQVRDKSGEKVRQLAKVSPQRGIERARHHALESTKKAPRPSFLPAPAPTASPNRNLRFPCLLRKQASISETEATAANRSSTDAAPEPSLRDADHANEWLCPCPSPVIAPCRVILITGAAPTRRRV